MSILQYCACGCHTLVRGALHVNCYHEDLHQQGEVWRPYTASLLKPVPAPRADAPMAEVDTGQVQSYPSLTVADLPDIDLKSRPWLVMWEAGWSVEKIAATWNEAPETVSQILDNLTEGALPPHRIGTGGLYAKARVTARRTRIRHLYHKQGWSLEQLRQAYPVYSRAMLEKMLKQSLTPKPAQKVCKRCEALILGKRSSRKYCSDTCRKLRFKERSTSGVLEPA
jgi:hypothetical protein